MRMVYNHCEMFHSAMVSFDSIIARILSALPAGHISDACMNGWRPEKKKLTFMTLILLQFTNMISMQVHFPASYFQCLGLCTARAGFIWWEVLSYSNCEPTLPLLRGKNGKALLKLRKTENDDIDPLKVRSITILKNHYYNAPRSLRLLLPSTQKRSMTRNCWNRTWLAETGLLISSGKPAENATVKIFDKTHGLPFL